jgi:ankyrin repeat protein
MRLLMILMIWLLLWTSYALWRAAELRPGRGPLIAARPAALDPAKAWRQAIATADHTAVGALLQAGPVDVRIGKGDTPLAVALQYEKLAIARLLLEKGANPNLVDESGTRPLLVAAFRDRLEEVKLLLEYKADPNVSDDWAGTPLFYARKHGNRAMEELLLKSGARPDFRAPEPPLVAAARAGDLARVSALLAGGARPNVADADGLTPYLHAQRRHDENMMQLLVKSGANPRFAPALSRATPTVPVASPRSP